MIHGVRIGATMYSEKGPDTNTDAEREFRYCTSLALKRPYKDVLPFPFVICSGISHFLPLLEPKE